MTDPLLDELGARIAAISPDWAAVRSPEPRGTTCTGAHPIPPAIARGVEAIREGWLLHRDASRVVRGASPNLALLIGDWCYAAGLCDVTEHGTLDDVAELARRIADLSTSDLDHESLDARWVQSLDALVANAHHERS